MADPTGIVAAAAVAFVTVPVTANANAHKHACYGLEACKDTTAKGCDKNGAMHITHKECKKMGGMTKKEFDKKDATKK